MDSKHFVSCAGLVRNEKGQLLLVKSPLRGWEYPGGLIEHGETFQQALKREIEEEAGVQVRIEAFIGICKNLEQDIVNIDFACRYLGGQLRESEESTEVIWASEEEAFRLITHPLTKKRLQGMLSACREVKLFGFRYDPFVTQEEETYPIGI